MGFLLILPSLWYILFSDMKKNMNKPQSEAIPRKRIRAPKRYDKPGAPPKKKKEGTIGFRVHELRMKMGITMHEFAKRSKVSISCINRIENSSKSLDLRVTTLHRIATFCNVSIEFLLFGK